MHLTRFEINPGGATPERCSVPRNSCTPPSSPHSVVPAGTRRSRVLLRLEEGPHDHLLYIVSPLEPASPIWQSVGPADVRLSDEGLQTP